MPKRPKARLYWAVKTKRGRIWCLQTRRKIAQNWCSPDGETVVRVRVIEVRRG